VDSGRGSRGFWDQGIEFGATYHIGKLLNIDALNGVKAFGNFRYRDSQRASNPNEFVQANSMFNPSNWESGTQFRVMDFGLEIGTSRLLPVTDMIVFKGGSRTAHAQIVSATSSTQERRSARLDRESACAPADCGDEQSGNAASEILTQVEEWLLLPTLIQLRR